MPPYHGADPDIPPRRAVESKTMLLPEMAALSGSVCSVESVVSASHSGFLCYLRFLLLKISSILRNLFQIPLRLSAQITDLQVLTQTNYSPPRFRICVFRVIRGCLLADSITDC